MSTTVSYKGNTIATVNNNTKTLETEGKYLEADIVLTDVSQSAPVLQTVSKSYTPTESQQTEQITPGQGYDGIQEVDVTVGAISPSYVGSGIDRRSSTDMSVNDDTVTAPAGYYANSSSKQVATGTEGTPSASKGSVSNHSVQVTPSVTNVKGFIQGGSHSGTPVTVSASELVSGSQTVQQNGTVDVTNLAEIVVDVQGGGSGMQVGTATATPASAGSSIQFTGLSGEPTSFSVISAANLATGAAPYKVNAVVFDGTNVIGQYITNTSNANETYDGSGFSMSYSNGTLTITSTNASFQANQYKLIYTYGGSSANIGTDQVQVGSGATSITFTDLPEEPSCWYVIFTSNIGTSSGYTRTLCVASDGTNTYGMEMGSSALATSNWSASYSNGSLTISSQSTSAGGYFHQPGYYELVYATGEAIEIETEPLSVTENGTYTAPRGKAYTPVSVNVSGGGSATVATKTTTLSAVGQTLTFTGLSGTPKMWAVRCTTQVSSSGSTTYYYLMDAVYDGSAVKGNCFRIGSTRRIQNVTSGLSQAYSGGTLAITGGSSSGATPGQWYNGEYELTYIY